MSSKIRGVVKSALVAGRATVSAAQRAIASALDRSVSSSCASNQGVADACGVSEKTLRTARDPESGESLAHYRLLLLPRKVFVAYLRELAVEYERLHGEGLTLTRERQGFATSGAAIELIGELTASLADGVISPAEREKLMPAIARLDVELQKLRRAVASDEERAEDDRTAMGAGAGAAH